MDRCPSSRPGYYCWNTALQWPRVPIIYQTTLWYPREPLSHFHWGRTVRLVCCWYGHSCGATVRRANISVSPFVFMRALMSILTWLLFYFRWVIAGNVSVHVRTDCAFFLFLKDSETHGEDVCVCAVSTHTHTHTLLWYCRAVRFLPFIPSQQRCQENRLREKESLWLAPTKPASIFVHIHSDYCLVK